MRIIGKILVPVDFSEAALGAARYAAALAQTHQARLYVLHVKEPFPVHGRIVAGSLEDVQKQRIIKEQAGLSAAIPAEFKNSIAVEEIQVTGTPIYRVIVETARQFSVDVIVMASQDRKGWTRFFKNNTAARVIRDTPCSVFLVKGGRNQTISEVK
jgi:nucleotide-binding universal stress UspA family protein